MLETVLSHLKQTTAVARGIVGNLGKPRRQRQRQRARRQTKCLMSEKITEASALVCLLLATAPQTDMQKSLFAPWWRSNCPELLGFTLFLLNNNVGE